MKMNKNDYFLIIACAVLAGVLFLIFEKCRDDNGKYVVVRDDGEIVLELCLETETEYRYKNSYGFNTIVIKNNCVYVESSDCHNEECIRQGKISKTGESIVCLPHKVVISIGAGNIKTENDELDGVAG